MTKMTKILGFGILLLFVCSMQLSAQKCKYAYDKQDPFTGEVTKGISIEIWKKSESSMPSVTHSGKPFRYIFDLCKIGDKYLVNANIYFGGNVRELIRKGDSFLIKLSNGETITLTAQDDVVPIAIGQPSGGFWSQFKVKYNIDSESLKKMSESAPAFFRFSLENNTFDKELSSGDQKKITQAATCILQ